MGAETGGEEETGGEPPPRLARAQVVAALTVVCQRSKQSMASGGTPTCLVDFWAQRVNEIIAEAKAEGKAPPAFTGDHDMGETVMDFLFASQDASTASLAWAVHFLSERPDVLHLVREEQAKVRPNNEPITFELLEQVRRPLLLPPLQNPCSHAPSLPPARFCSAADGVCSLRREGDSAPPHPSADGAERGAARL